ncbi:MAG: extracellular solute-binding protein [Alicyclobacillus sp.]|nr:extracellular solute-binding protein [Alicyclobacillus sp.]
MNRPKTGICIAVCIATVAGVAGCGSTSGSNNTSTSTGSSGKQVTVTLWSWTPVDSTMKKIVAAIERKYPNINIQTSIEPHADYNTALQAAAASGSLPDIIGLPPGSQTQQYREDLQPLDPIAQQLWGVNWQSNFPASAIKQATLGNPAGDTHFYMLPQETEVINLWYNKKIFSQLDLTPPKTVDEMIRDAQKIKAAGYIPFYQGAAQTNFDTWLFEQIAAQTDLQGLQDAQVGKATWTQPGMIQAAQVWKRLFDNKVFQDGATGDQQYPTGANLFAAGRVGMISLGSWWLQEAALDTSPQGLKTMSDYGTFFFPAVTPGGNPTPPMGGIDFGWGLTKNAAKDPAVQQASETVLKELISGVGEQIMVNDLNDLPAFKGFQPQTKYSDSIQTIYQNYLSEVDKAYNHDIGNPSVEQALDSNLQAIAVGRETPEQAMTNVQAVAQK